jgi:hypothetical protein
MSESCSSIIRLYASRYESIIRSILTSLPEPAGEIEKIWVMTVAHRGRFYQAKSLPEYVAQTQTSCL